MNDEFLKGNMARAKLSGVTRTVHQITADPRGHEIAVYHYAKPRADGSKTAPTPAIMHMHGGGMIAGSPTIMDAGVIEHVLATDIPFFSVDYRLAPEHPHPAALEDCYAALLWLREHASKFNVDVSRIAVAGESAGGGLSASVALLARKNALSPPIAKQILVYPMLDDRTLTEDPLVEPFALWTTDDNRTAWGAVLGRRPGSPADEDVSSLAAPAREKNLQGLPSAFVDAGALDIFRDEAMDYAQRLAKAGVDVEFHLYPGLPHGFDLFAPGIEPSKLAQEARRRAMLTL